MTFSKKVDHTRESEGAYTTHPGFAGSQHGSRRRGRPSRAQSADLTETILTVAAKLFLDAGFRATSMDSIAAQTGSSKRTLYSRFPSKVVLFEEVIRRLAHARVDELAKFESSGEPIDLTLHKIGRVALARALEPVSIALFRLMIAEAHSFPDLPSGDRRWFLAHITSPLVRIFAAASKEGQIVDHDPSFLAEQFLEMVCSREVRRVAMGEVGSEMTPERHERLARVVDMFIAGIKAPAAQMA